MFGASNQSRRVTPQSVHLLPEAAMNRPVLTRLTALALLICPLPALADAVPTANSAATAWMLPASLLVLMMSLPGLALFYGGLVRSKNVLSVLMQCVAIVSLVTVLWVAYGYSLA